MIDSLSLYSILTKVQPAEVYNLAAQSHVGVSFSVPDYSSQVNALGTLRLLNAIREIGLTARFYQASTSELFGGLPGTIRQCEQTPFSPRSPYAAAKLFAYWSTCNYREGYGLYTCNGILFNHESPRRGQTFVTKKISKAVARIAQGKQDLIRLGNLSAKRDWAYAREFVEARWLMLQQPTPDDFVIGTGVSFSVRSFVEFCFAAIGVEIVWRGVGQEEVGVERRSGITRVVIDPSQYRPLETEQLQADPRKVAQALNWQPKMLAPELSRFMVRYDLAYDEYGHPDIVPGQLIEDWIRN